VTFTAKQVEQLLKPINNARVLSDGKGHAHVSQQDVLAHLIRVFGFGGFDIEVMSVKCVFEQERANGQGESTNRFDVCYRALVRLTIRDETGGTVCTYENGSTATAQNQSRGDAHDLAYKSAISLSVKRAAIALGDQFGLSLYNKGQRTALVMGTLVGAPAADPLARPRPSGDIQDGVAQQLALGHDEADIPLEADRPAERLSSTPPDDPFYDTPPRPRGSRQASTKAVGKLNALLTDLGITDRDKALEKVSGLVGVAVASRNDLTSAQISKAIKALESELEQPFPEAATS
jgi:hypothetical protein